MHICYQHLIQPFTVHYLQGDVPVSNLYIESGIWSILWHRLAQMLQVKNPDTDMPLHDLETDMVDENSVFPTPDWSLLSFQGLLGVLNLAVAVFTKVLYILVYKSIFWVVKREFPEVPRLIRRSYFLPAEGKEFSAILDTQHYRIQPNKSQSQNKFVTSLPTNPLLFNK